jgi:hypothetical protein
MCRRSLLACLLAAPMVLCQANEHADEVEPFQAALASMRGHLAAPALDGAGSPASSGIMLSWRGARWSMAPQWSLQAGVNRSSAQATTANQQLSTRLAPQPGQSGQPGVGLQLKLSHHF